MFLSDKAGWQPVLDSLRTGRRERRLWILGSVLVHGLALVVLCWPGKAAYIKPIWLAHGAGGSATPASVVLYLSSRQVPAAENPLLSLPSPPTQKLTSKTKVKKRTNVLKNEKPAEQMEAGSTLGTSFDGAAAGDEIKPGFAIRFTAPRVSRSELPGGTPGDVIVELTIDAEGNVVEEKLLQGLGQSIDDRVITSLRDWHFRPATRNGIAIPFKYDAHFHFPS